MQTVNTLHRERVSATTADHWFRLLAVASAGLLLVVGAFQAMLPPTEATDFVAFWTAGSAVLHGTPPYVHSYHVDSIAITGDANLNAPLSALLFAPFGLLPFATALWLFRALSLLAYLATLLILRRSFPSRVTGLRLLWALCVGAVWFTLSNGQLYLLLDLAFAGAFVLRRRDRILPAAGLLALVVLVKPNFGVVPLFLLLAGDWRMVRATTIASLPLALAPALVCGPGIYRDWLAAITSAHNAVVNTRNASLVGIATAAGVPALGWVLAALFVLGVGAWVWRARPGVDHLWPAALAVALLASPEALAEYAVFLVPSVITARWSGCRWMPVIVFLVPPLAFAVLPRLVPGSQVATLSLTLAFLATLPRPAAATRRVIPRSAVSRLVHATNLGEPCAALAEQLR